MSDTSRAFLAALEKDLAAKFTKAGLYFVSQLRGSVNTAQPYTRSPAGNYHGKNPSRPGQFPHKLSGQLAKSLTWELDKRKMVLTVGSNLKGHPSFLETGTKWMAPRPWLSLGFKRDEAAIARIITGR